MEWFGLRGAPGGYLVHTLSPSRVTFTARSSFNKLFSRSFRDRLSTKSIILHISSNRFILMTKRKQPWSPICNLQQTMVNKAITLTLDLTYMTSIKNGVRQDLWTMPMCLFKFFRSFHYQQTCQTCSQKCLIYPCSSDFQLLSWQLSVGGTTCIRVEPSHLPLTITLYSLIPTHAVLHNGFFSTTVYFFKPGQLHGWGRTTLKAGFLWLQHQGLQS